MSPTLLSFLAPYLHRITRIYRKLLYMMSAYAVVRRGVSYAHGTHGTQREMAGMDIQCAYDTQSQTTAFFNVIFGHFTMYSRDSGK